MQLSEQYEESAQREFTDFEQCPVCESYNIRETVAIYTCSRCETVWVASEKVE